MSVENYLLAQSELVLCGRRRALEAIYFTDFTQEARESAY